MLAKHSHRAPSPPLALTLLCLLAAVPALGNEDALPIRDFGRDGVAVAPAVVPFLDADFFRRDMTWDFLGGDNYTASFEIPRAIEVVVPLAGGGGSRLIERPVLELSLDLVLGNRAAGEPACKNTTVHTSRCDNSGAAHTWFGLDDTLLNGISSTADCTDGCSNSFTVHTLF